MHVVCPHCGTGYTLGDAMAARARLRLRCRHCREVWDPHARPEPTSEPEPEPEPGPAPGPGPAPEPAASAVAVSSAPVAAAGASAPPKWRMVAVLYLLASLALVGGASALGWAYRGALPSPAASLPQLSEVEPTWRSDERGRRLWVSAAVDNPGGEPAEVRRVRVKFLSAQGAWIAETVVDVTPVTVPPGGSAAVEMAVDRLPEGTASLELSVLPPTPVS